MFSRTYGPTYQRQRTRQRHSPSSTLTEMRHGAVSVELAIVAPLVFLFIFASVEFGRLNMLHHAVDNAAYESARQCMVPGATVAEATTVAQQHLGIFGVTGATIQVTPSSITEDTEQITVLVTVPMDQNSWIAPTFSGGAQVQSSSTLRTERYRGLTSS